MVPMISFVFNPLQTRAVEVEWLGIQWFQVHC